MSGPFKMKGSPMQRNFGIGAPTKGKLDNLLRGVFSGVNKASKKINTKTQEIGDSVSKTVGDIASKVNTASKNVNTATQKVGSDAASAVSQVTSGVDKVSKGLQKEVTKVSKGVQKGLSTIFGKEAIAKRKAKRAARKANRAAKSN